MNYIIWRYEAAKVRDIVIQFIAWRLPKRLVMWCAIRLMAYATQGKYGNQVVPDLTAMDALQRWPVK